MTTLCNLGDFHDSFQNSLNHQILLFNVPARGTCLRTEGSGFKVEIYYYYHQFQA